MGLVPVVGVRFGGVWEVLIHLAAVAEGEHLHAKADA